MLLVRFFLSIVHFLFSLVALHFRHSCLNSIPSLTSCDFPQKPVLLCLDWIIVIISLDASFNTYTSYQHDSLLLSKTPLNFEQHGSNLVFASLLIGMLERQVNLGP